MGEIWARYGRGFGRDIGEIWARYKRDVSEILARCGRDIDEMWGRYWRDVGDILTRCGGDIGGMWARYWWDVGEMQARAGPGFVRSNLPMSIVKNISLLCAVNKEQRLRMTNEP